MVGRVHYGTGGWGRVEEQEFYGLSLLASRVDPEGWFGPGRLRRAGKGLSRRGVRRTLVPPLFEGWAMLEPWGLAPVSVLPLVRAKAGEVALAALERVDAAPDRAVVALRASRADRNLIDAACLLCPRVRHLIIDVPQGGEELARWLRWEFGMPILPSQEMGTVALQFDRAEEREEQTLRLYGQQPDLKGVAFSAPALAEEDREDLPLLSLLWERGRLGPEGLKIT